MKGYYSQDVAIHYKRDDKRVVFYDDATYDFIKQGVVDPDDGLVGSIRQRDFVYICQHIKTIKRDTIKSFTETFDKFVIDGIVYSKDEYSYKKSDDKQDLSIIKRLMILIDDDFKNVEMIYRAI